MNRQNLVRRCLFIAAAAGASVALAGSAIVACSSSGAEGAAGASGAGSADSGGASCPANSALIDDMSGKKINGPGLAGYWFTYSDQTNPYSEPPIFLPDAAGTLSPEVGDTFGPNAAGPGAIQNARECKGGGEVVWGAGYGFDFIDVAPDGGNKVPYWACDGGGPNIWNDAPDAGTGIPLPFDASAHKGVSFWAISNSGSLMSVQVKLSENRTNAWGTVCNACATSAYLPNEQCGDDYLYLLSVPTTWQQFTIHFADPELKPANWSKQNLMPGGFDPSTFYSLHFQFHTSKVALAPFDISIACVQFVDD
jgi:hypothetical protein